MHAHCSALLIILILTDGMRMRSVALLLCCWVMCLACGTHLQRPRKPGGAPCVAFSWFLEQQDWLVPDVPRASFLVLRSLRFAFAS